jgi:hypothetical protein
MPRIQSNVTNPPTVISRLKSQNTLGSVVDGTSNTVMIGEKNMYYDWLGHMDIEHPASIGHCWHPYYNVRILGYIQNPATQTYARGLPPRLPIPPIATFQYTDPGNPRNGAGAGRTITNESWVWSFGSWHPTITLFTMADAAVRPIRNTADPIWVLPNLGARADGTQVSLPN